MGSRQRNAGVRTSGWAFAALAAILGIALVGCGSASDGNASPSPQQASSPFNGERAFKDLSTMVAFGPRPAGSEALAKTRAYIVDELKKAGLKPELDEFEATTPRGKRKMVNIRATRAGARPDIIALTGHYDTKPTAFEFVGANDGGSSAAWVLEMARATVGLKLENTLEFVFFDGEEAVVEWSDGDSVYGSRHDVDRRLRAGKLGQLKALILVDMIGDKDLDIRREPTSTAWLTDLIWKRAHARGFRKEFLDEPLPIEDDHIPFLRAGVNAVDLIDFNYEPWHTPNDTLDKTSGSSLKIVGDVIYDALPEIDKRVSEMKK
ncbi:MAG TPA: M28 family peptidase [Terriglobia bacterium]|nr:M28 family peptidase [Terriglobia bacterium]